MDFDVGVMHAPIYSGLVAALLLILHVVLMVRVIMRRGQAEVNIGDGGDEALEQRIRVHANLLENAPLFVAALAMLEMIVGSTVWVAVIGGVFAVARIDHAVGYSMTTGVSAGRLVGTLGTMISILAVAGYLGYVAITNL